METYHIKIADLTIALMSADPELELQVTGATTRFLVDTAEPDVILRAAWGELDEANSGQKLFDSGCVWQLYAEADAYRFRFASPALGVLPYKVARLRRDFSAGEIVLHRPYFLPGDNPKTGVYAENRSQLPPLSAAIRHPQPAIGIPQERVISPLEYPLDELLLLHLLAHGRGVEVHACGVVDPQGHGHLFLGQSGAGKTTMARLWLRQEGVQILSDDRIIVRNMDGRLWMYGTPWHGEAGLAMPARAPLTRIYFLQHDQTNALVPQRATEALGRLLACSFLPFYSPAALDFTLGFLEDVVHAVPCQALTFLPDARVVTFIRHAAA